MIDKKTLDILNVKLTNLDQIGIVVHDVYVTSQVFESTFGVGPFRIVDWPIDGIDPMGLYLGKSAKWRMREGFAQIGGIQLELIQPLEGRSIFSDFLEEHGPGIHHIRFNIPNYEETVNTLLAAGIDLISSGTGVHLGSQWAYFDTRQLLDGVLIELRKFLDNSQSKMSQVIDNTIQPGKE